MRSVLIITRQEYGVSIPLITKQSSLAGVGSVLGCEAAPGSVDMSEERPQTIWKIHFDELVTPASLLEQLSSACEWLENQIEPTRANLPIDTELYLLIGVYMDVTARLMATAKLPSNILARLARHSVAIEVCVYATDST